MSAQTKRSIVALADRYRVERELRVGGMATVYLADNIKHERDVTIKVLHLNLGTAISDNFFRMNDTRPEAAAVVRSAIQQTPPAERIRQMLDMSEKVRALSLVGLRARYPELSTLQLVERLLGQTLVPVPPGPGEYGR